MCTLGSLDQSRWSPALYWPLPDLSFSTKVTNIVFWREVSKEYNSNRTVCRGLVLTIILFRLHGHIIPGATPAQHLLAAHLQDTGGCRGLFSLYQSHPLHPGCKSSSQSCDSYCKYRSQICNLCLYFPLFLSSASFTRRYLAQITFYISTFYPLSGGGHWCYERRYEKVLQDKAEKHFH